MTGNSGLTREKRCWLDCHGLGLRCFMVLPVRPRRNDLTSTALIGFPNMHETHNATSEFLRALDQRQEQVLKDLEELNQRVEKVLEMYQQSRHGKSTQPVVAASSSGTSQRSEAA